MVTEKREQYQAKEFVGDRTDFERMLSETMNGVDVAPPPSEVDDIGKYINRWDSNAKAFNALWIQPGVYSQATPIEINTTGVSIFGAGALSGSVPNTGGARLKKTGDFDAITLNASSTVSNLQIEGKEVNDSSHGLVVHDRCTIVVRSDRHGGDGIRLEQQSGDNLNRCQIRCATNGNTANGVHTINVSGDPPDVNSMHIRVHECYSNGGHGVYIEDGFSQTLDLHKCQQNGGYAVVSKSNYNILNVAYTEGNSTGSVDMSGAFSNSLTAGILNEGPPELGAERSHFVNKYARAGTVVPEVDDGNRLGASEAPDGAVVYNSTDGNLNISSGDSWILPDGTTT